MSPFDDQSAHDQHAQWRAQVHEAAAQKLAQALAAQQAASPASSALEFQHSLGRVIAQLAQEELALIENMTGTDLLEKLLAAQPGQSTQFTPEQAQQLGAFEEDAIGEDDLDEPGKTSSDRNGQDGDRS